MAHEGGLSTGGPLYLTLITSRCSEHGKSIWPILAHLASSVTSAATIKGCQWAHKGPRKYGLGGCSPKGTGW